MNKIKKSTLLLLMASSLLLSGCDVISAQDYDKLENISSDFGSIDSGSVSEETTDVKSATLTNAENDQIHKTTDENSNSTNEYLPEGISMDDLLNMIQIDGKTLSMPTTLENILALNDDFTCEMAFSDLYASPEDSINDLGGVFYDIKYKNEKLFQIVISKDDYNGDYMTSRIYKFSSLLNVENFKKDNLNFNIINGIEFDCSFDKVIKTFGEPNTHTNATNSFAYKFYDKNVIYKIEFLYYLDEKENEYDNKHICSINVQTEKV